MPTFNDKSIQGIIDVIKSDLTCIVEPTDKSLQGIIDKAEAAGVDISDVSIQGIIDILKDFSCTPPVVLDPTYAFDWDTEITIPSRASNLTVFSSPTNNWSMIISSYGGGSYSHIAGDVGPSTGSASDWVMLLTTIEVWSRDGLTKHGEISRPVMSAPGVSVQPLNDDTWRNTGAASTKMQWDSSLQTIKHYTTDIGGAFYVQMPSLFRGDHSGGNLVIASGAPDNALVQEDTIIDYLAAGTEITIKVATGAVVVEAGDEISAERFIGVNLMDRYRAGETTGIRVVSMDKLVNATDPLVNWAATDTIDNAWGNITNPVT